jgi:hypothetical protein
MLRLNDGVRAGHTGRNIGTMPGRRHTGLLVLGTTLALLVCMLTAPALHAATIPTHHAALGKAAPAAIGTHTNTLIPASVSTLVRKDPDCSAYFDAVFDAMDGLDQAMTAYDNTADGGGIAEIVGEAYVAWAAGQVRVAASKLSSCLGG